MAIANLLTTDTFKTWYTLTNEIITALNESASASGTTAFGSFVLGAAANTSMNVCNSLFVNTSVVWAHANTKVTANCTVCTIEPTTLILNPSGGTRVNSALTVNTTTLFSDDVTINAASLTVNGDVTTNGTFDQSGNASFDSDLFVRNVTWSMANAMLEAASLESSQFNDYYPTGLANSQFLNLSPSLNVAITGIAAPTTITDGARLLYIQNLSDTFFITFAAANTESSANNRFKTPNDDDYLMSPGGAAAFMWSTTDPAWRLLSGAGTNSDGPQSFGNTTINGWLKVTSDTELQANCTVNGACVVSGYMVIPVGTDLWA